MNRSGLGIKIVVDINVRGVEVVVVWVVEIFKIVGIFKFVERGGVNNGRGIIFFLEESFLKVDFWKDFVIFFVVVEKIIVGFFEIFGLENFKFGSFFNGWKRDVIILKNFFENILKLDLEVLFEV